MPDYADFVAYQEQLGAERHARLAAHRHRAAQVVLHIDDLIGSDDWRLFLEHLDALRAPLAAELAMLLDQISGDAVGDELMKLKLRARRLEGHLAGLDQARALPDQIRASAKSLDEASGA